MKQVEKEAWLKALRSGDFEQGTGTLRRRLSQGEDARYCCLGVACGVLLQGSWNEDTEQFEMADGRTVSGYGSIHPDLDPEPVGGLLGLTQDTRIALVSMNDQDGCTFSEIADYIEQNIPAEEDEI